MRFHGMTAAMVAVGMMAVTAAPSMAQNPPSGTLTLSGGAVAAGIGFSWGSGVLTFQGKQYPFSVRGLSVVDVGASSVRGSGTVYNLKDVAFFSGNYTAVGAGATIAGGASVATMRNQHGVVINLTSTTQGLRFNLSASGVAINLRQ
jgi:hypothetical protein